MSIVKSVMPDPFAAFAWRACMANLTLQKIRQSHDGFEGCEALTELSKDVNDLATVVHEGVTAPLVNLDKRLIDLSRLVVDPSVQIAGHELDLDQLKEDLCHVVEYPTGLIDDALLERIQKSINELIERANSFRPQPSRSTLIECVA
jgi:hypothetical protein